MSAPDLFEMATEEARELVKPDTLEDVLETLQSVGFIRSFSIEGGRLSVAGCSRRLDVALLAVSAGQPINPSLSRKKK